MSSLSEKYAEYRASTGRKLTAHQAASIDKIASLPGTFAADDVVRAMNGSVSRATVYRTLKLLVEADLIRQVAFNDQVVYVVKAT